MSIKIEVDSKSIEFEFDENSVAKSLNGTSRLRVVQQNIFTDEIFDQIDFDIEEPQFTSKQVAVFMLRAYMRGAEDGRRNVLAANGHAKFVLPE